MKSIFVLFCRKVGGRRNEGHKASGDKGLVLMSRAKHHAISAKLNKPFLFDTKPLIVQ